MNLKTSKGFTIVELLIVIVVIAILAAISIVAYSGIQQRGRDSGRAADVSNLVKALTAYTTDDTSAGGSGGTWPTNAADAVTKLNAYTQANVPATVVNKLNAAAVTSTNKDTNYQYLPCPATGTPTGATITYYKEQGGAPNSVTVKAGAGC